MNLEYKECATCAAKPGSPTLCAGCYNNRTVIGRLQDRIALLHVEYGAQLARERSRFHVACVLLLVLLVLLVLAACGAVDVDNRCDDNAQVRIDELTSEVDELRAQLATSDARVTVEGLAQCDDGTMGDVASVTCSVVIVPNVGGHAAWVKQ